MNALCGKPMRRHEVPGHPQLEDPACGRREDHPGTCRSRESLERIRLYEAGRAAPAWAARKRKQRDERIHAGLSAAIAAAVARARQDARVPERAAVRSAA
jgi:hypothetical protein